MSRFQERRGLRKVGPMEWVGRCPSSGYEYLLILLGSCGCGSANPVELTYIPHNHRADGTTAPSGGRQRDS